METPQAKTVKPGQVIVTINVPLEGPAAAAPHATPWPHQASQHQQLDYEQLQYIFRCLILQVQMKQFQTYLKKTAVQTKT